MQINGWLLLLEMKLPIFQMEMQGLQVMMVREHQVGLDGHSLALLLINFLFYTSRYLNFKCSGNC